MNPKRWIVLFVIPVLGLALLNACSSNGELTEVETETLSQLRVITGHYHAGHRMMTKIAMEKGFFQEEGLSEVEITPMGTHDDWLNIAALEEGKADIIWDAHSDIVVQASAKGMDVSAIEVFRSAQPGTYIFGRKGLSSLQDLKGKRIGVNEIDGMSARQVRKALKVAGIDPEEDVVLVPHTVGQYATMSPSEALEQDVVQAIPGTGSRAARLRELGYPTLTGSDLSELFPPGYPIRFMVSTGELIREYPEAVSAFLRGIVRAKRFAADDLSRAEVTEIRRKLLQEDVSFGGERAEAARQELETMDREESGRVEGSGRREDYFDPKGLEFLLEEQKELGYIPASYVADQLNRINLAEEAVREIDERYGPGGYESKDYQ